MVKKKRGKGLTINLHFTNRWLYTLIAIGILAIIGVGVYAYNSGLSPSVMGHSAGELDLSGGVNGNAVFNGPVTANAGINTSNIVLKTKVIEIGDWNMEINRTSLFITHGLTYSKIRSFTSAIRTDASSPWQMLKEIGFDKSGVITAGSTTFVMERWDGGWFDSSNYDATNYNRGWITVTYEA